MAYTAPSITTSGTTFSQLPGAGLNGLLENLITANSGTNQIPNAAPTLSTTGTGNTLPTGTYYVAVTESNGMGETPASPVASQAVTLGAALVVTFHALMSGNVSRNVYVGTASTGPFTLVATGITASSYNVGAPLPTNSWSAVHPPTVNSTGITSDGSPDKMRRIRAGEVGNLQDDWKALNAIVANFAAGQPVPWQQAIQKLRNVHTALAMMNQACVELGTLIDANPGTIKYVQDPIGNMKQVRSFP